MQENEFEKQVKEMMGDFRVVPSEPVWNNIKKQLKERRRRVWPFIFLLLMITVSGGAIIYFNNIEHSTLKQTALINKQSIANKNKVKQQESKTGEVTIAEQKNLKSQAFKNDSVKRKNIKAKNQNSDHLKHKQNNFSTAATDLHVHSYSLQKPSGNSKNKKWPNNAIEIHSSENKPAVKINDETVSAQSSNIYQPPLNISTSKEITSVKNDTLKKISISVDTANKAVSATSKTKSSTKKNNALQFGLSAFLGKNNITNNFLNLNSAKSLAPGYLYNSGTSIGSIGGIVSPLRPAKLYFPATSFSFGFIVNKPISKHIYISSGLNYLYLSTTTQTGIHVDSLTSIQYANQPIFYLNNYYRTGSSTFTNKFHFIELPVMFKQDFIHSKKISVSYTAGFSVMQLISANALIYDAGKNIYYSKNSMLKRTQFQLSAGLNFQINLKNSTAISIGPQINYSLPGFLKNSNINTLHYNNYGVKLNWLFNHK